jgi:UrcA family protein
MLTRNLKRESTKAVRMHAFLLVGCLLPISASLANTVPPRADIPSMKVSYSALDLATDEGARNLYGRIAKAARAVCPDEGVRDLNTFAFARTCQAEAIARAVRDVRNPRLAALYSARTGHG